jgi:DNA-binding transcriptional MocR family regulator
MVPFRIKFSPGHSIFDQVCFAAIKSILAGELKSGEAFPSVRALALDLKIHPNTAHKVVQHLIQERWLMEWEPWSRSHPRRARVIASGYSKTKWRNSWWRPCAWAPAWVKCNGPWKTRGGIFGA